MHDPCTGPDLPAAMRTWPGFSRLAAEQHPQAQVQALWLLHDWVSEVRFFATPQTVLAISRGAAHLQFT